MELAIEKREILAKKTKYLRAEDKIPAVIYGKVLKENVNITLPKQDFLRLYKKAGLSTPLNLVEGKEKYYVLIHDMQLDPVTDRLLHVDFLAIDKNQKVTAEVPVITTGVAPVEKLGQGRVQQIKDSIEVEALPADLPHDIKVDLTGLKSTNDVIFVKDLPLPKGVEAKEDPDRAVITVVELSSGEEEETEAVMPEGEEPKSATA